MLPWENRTPRRTGSWRCLCARLNPGAQQTVMTASPLDRIHLNRRGFVAATLASGFALAACARSTTPASTDDSITKYVALTFDDGPTPFTDRLLGVGGADARHVLQHRRTLSTSSCPC